MTQTPGLLLTLVAFVAVIGPLVFVHEMGHYLAGRLFGIGADAFSIGFGREILGWTDRRGTRWKLGWLPLGGYVKFAGDMNPAGQPSADWLALPPEARNRTFQSKPVWQRAIVVAAGPAVNLLLALVILTGFVIAYGVDRTPAVVGVVVPNSAAAAAGLQPGDRITALGDTSIETYVDLQQVTLLHPGERLVIHVDRSGRALEVPATLRAVVVKDRFGNESRIGRLGVGATAAISVKVPVWQAPGVAVQTMGQILATTYEGVRQVIVGERSFDDLGGPVKIAKLSGEQITLGWAAFIWFIAMLSINLGVVNLLPIPLLDGGHLFFYAIEAVRRRPVGPQVMDWAFRGGLALLVTLLVAKTLNDLGSLGLWKGLAGLIG